MKNMVYADNAATTVMDKEAFQAMEPYFLHSFGNPSQPYSFSRLSRKAIQEARKTIAKCINADESEIYFTSGGTESDNWAINCLDTNRATIITDVIEHHAVLNVCKTLKNKSIVYLNVDNTGNVDCKSLKDKINEDVSLVSIMMANNEIGTVQNIKELCAIAHSNGALFHTDAVQAVGHIKIDVKELGVDMLSASAHKFNGPKGIGFLYIKKGTKIHPLINGGKQEKTLRAGTESVPLIVGMAVALSNNCLSIDKNSKHLIDLEKTFFRTLNDGCIDYIRNGSSNHLPGLISISIRGTNGETILHRLDLMGFCISTGSACDNVKNEISHVIKAINIPQEYAEGTIRISFGKYNTLLEAKELALAISSIINNE